MLKLAGSWSWSEFLTKPNSHTVVRRAERPHPLPDFNIFHSERRRPLLRRDGGAAASDGDVLLHKLGAGTRRNAPGWFAFRALEFVWRRLEQESQTLGGSLISLLSSLSLSLAVWSGGSHRRGQTAACHLPDEVRLVPDFHLPLNISWRSRYLSFTSTASSFMCLLLLSLSRSPPSSVTLLLKEPRRHYSACPLKFHPLSY